MACTKFLRLAVFTSFLKTELSPCFLQSPFLIDEIKKPFTIPISIHVSSKLLSHGNLTLCKSLRFNLYNGTRPVKLSCDDIARNHIYSFVRAVDYSPDVVLARKLQGRFCFLITRENQDFQPLITYKAIPTTRKTLKLLHLLFHLIALATGILGVYTVFKFHDELDIPHMYTLHSWIGLSTICLFGLQLLLGFVTFLFPGAEPATRARIAPWHVFSGLIIFVMLIVSAETGLIEKFIFQKLKHGQEALVVNFIGLLILVFGIFVGLIVVLPLRRK